MDGWNEWETCCELKNRDTILLDNRRFVSFYSLLSSGGERYKVAIGRMEERKSQMSGIPLVQLLKWRVFNEA